MHKGLQAGAEAGVLRHSDIRGMPRMHKSQHRTCQRFCYEAFRRRPCALDADWMYAHRKSRMRFGIL
jgi:hypothetical protein